MIDANVLALTLVATAALLFGIERFAPLRRATRPLLGRLLVNIGISALAFTIAGLVVRPTVLAMLGRASDAPFGLVQTLPVHPAIRFAASFLLMDLFFYWWHVANHRIPFLWRFHNVHHIDPDLDVSTAFRFHFGEVALSAGFRVLQMTAIGPSFAMFALYEIVFQANTLFHHSNVRLPIRVERMLNLLLVTPRMHGIHHSQVRNETNSNYSVVFSCWDRLHRTLGLNVPQSEIVIGIPGYSTPADNRLSASLTLPFRRQRDYWRRPDGVVVERDPSTLAGDPSVLAE